MIPTYNCDDLFEPTLRSVLNQDPGPNQMQIAVVDDGSSSRYHEEVVERLAPGRIELYRRESNVGLARTWNECIARSRGHWVHILHQDDLVLPGFYETLALAEAVPCVGAAFCRHITINRAGDHLERSILHSPTAGVLADWLPAISRHQYITCPSIVVRRKVYEHIGGYSTDLCYTLDWEMWVRIAATYSVWFEPRLLACYRYHPGNETARLRRADRDLDDVWKTIAIIRSILPPEHHDAVGSGLLAKCRRDALNESCVAFQNGELRSGLKSFRRAIKCDPLLLFTRTGYDYAKWALKICLGKLRSTASLFAASSASRTDK
jgi:glycosyltransferase involved in cell wall biosynthesis